MLWLLCCAMPSLCLLPWERVGPQPKAFLSGEAGPQAITGCNLETLPLNVPILGRILLFSSVTSKYALELDLQCDILVGTSEENI